MKCEYCRRDSSPRKIVRIDYYGYNFCSEECLERLVRGRIASTYYSNNNKLVHCTHCGKELNAWYTVEKPEHEMFSDVSPGVFCSLMCTVNHFMLSFAYTEPEFLDVSARDVYELLRNAGIANVLDEDRVYKCIAIIEGRASDYYVRHRDHKLVSKLYLTPRTDKKKEVREVLIRIASMLANEGLQL